ncbi:unnamed protein product, partial [Urochloa humidicola]
GCQQTKLRIGGNALFPFFDRFRIKYADILDRTSKFCYWYSMILAVSSTGYVLKKRKPIRL